MALAGLYRQTERNGQAVDLYQQLIKNPTNTVPASAAKLQLAALYETTNPAQAKKLYAEIKDSGQNNGCRTDRSAEAFRRKAASPVTRVIFA